MILVASGDIRCVLVVRPKPAVALRPARVSGPGSASRGCVASGGGRAELLGYDAARCEGLRPDARAVDLDGDGLGIGVSVPIAERGSGHCLVLNTGLLLP